MPSGDTVGSGREYVLVTNVPVFDAPEPILTANLGLGHGARAWASTPSAEPILGAASHFAFGLTA